MRPEVGVENQPNTFRKLLTTRRGHIDPAALSAVSLNAASGPNVDWTYGVLFDVSVGGLGLDVDVQKLVSCVNLSILMLLFAT
jgi:hypothetical protein